MTGLGVDQGHGGRGAGAPEGCASAGGMSGGGRGRAHRAWARAPCAARASSAGSWHSPQGPSGGLSRPARRGAGGGSAGPCLSAVRTGPVRAPAPPPALGTGARGAARLRQVSMRTRIPSVLVASGHSRLGCCHLRARRCAAVWGVPGRGPWWPQELRGAPGGQPARIHGPQPYDGREDHLPAPGTSSGEGVLAPSAQVSTWPAAVPPAGTGAEGLAGRVRTPTHRHREAPRGC